MASELFLFLWQVPTHGFQWLDGELATDDDSRLVLPGDGATARVLVENASGSINYRRYAPLRDHPALFRTFADLVSTEDRLRTFANSYGPLGMERLVSVKPSGHEGVVGTMGETREVWLASLRKMKKAVGLWDLTRTGNRSELKKVIHWERDATGNSSVLYAPPGDSRSVSTVIASTNSNQEWLSHFREGDLVIPATAYLLRLINEEIEDQVSVRLLYDLPSGEAVLRMVPSTLLGCLWLQLAEAISGKKSQRMCLGCKEWFEIKARGSRSDKQFCSQACRNRLYRQRMASAHELREAGKKPKEIAALLEVDLASVQKWLKH